jgi:hypothetical protein
MRTAKFLLRELAAETQVEHSSPSFSDALRRTRVSA